MIEHVQAILRYAHRDEELDFISLFNLDLDEVPYEFIFETEHKDHIFYHLHKLNVLCQAAKQVASHD